MTTVDARAVGRHTPELPLGGRRQRAASTLSAYVALTKPRIIELLLLTTVPVMFMAADGVPRLWPVVATVLGGTMSAGSANALNCVVDADIDERMRRTRRRPLPRHDVTPRAALVFGLVLGAVSTLWLGLLVNWLSAGLALLANVYYVVGYSMLLKRRTPQNIVWGGAAGCFPVLIGWTGVTGELAWTPVVLFAVVFFWTPPHFWALAIRYRDDYAAADVPMLPVLAAPRVVARRIVWYAWATVATSLLLWPVAGTGWVYAGAAAALGAALLGGSYRLLAAAGSAGSEWAGESWSRQAMRLFHGSNLYLALLFLAVAIDPLLR